MKKIKFWMAGATLTLLASVSGCGGGSDETGINSHAQPTVTATLPKTATAGASVSITGITVSNASTLTVDWGDGTQDAPTTIPSSLTHTYAATKDCVKAGSCTINLAALGWGTAEVTGTVTVSPAPTLAATLPTVGTMNEPVTISGIVAANGTALSVDWGDGTKETPATSATSLTHIYTATGSYAIAMVLSGSNGTSANSTGSVTINAIAQPVLTATLPTGGVANVAVSITGLTAVDGKALSVDWGDGKTDTPAVATLATTLSHTYTGAGTYPIKLVLTGSSASTPAEKTGSIKIDATGELFISQYMTGTGSYKVIEIYNPTAAAVVLDGVYSVTTWNNGLNSTTATSSNSAGGTLPLTGTLAAGQTLLIYNTTGYAATNSTLKVAVDAAVAAGTAIKQADGVYNANYAASTQVAAFNGDDVVQLTKSGTVIDSFGVAGLRPTVSGSGAAAKGGWGKTTADDLYHTLIRKAGVVKGNIPTSSGTTPYWDPVADPNGYDVGTIDDYMNLGIR